MTKTSKTYRAYEIVSIGAGPLQAGVKRLECKKLGPLIAYQITTAVAQNQRQYMVTMVNLSPTARLCERTRVANLMEAADKVSYYKRLYKTPTRKTKGYLETP